MTIETFNSDTDARHLIKIMSNFWLLSSLPLFWLDQIKQNPKRGIYWSWCGLVWCGMADIISLNMWWIRGNSRSSSSSSKCRRYVHDSDWIWNGLSCQIQHHFVILIGWLPCVRLIAFHTPRIKRSFFDSKRKNVCTRCSHQ